MLTQRIVTAIILGMVVIASIVYLPLIGFSALAVLVVSLAVWEFAGFSCGNDYKNRTGFLVTFLFIFMFSRFFSVQSTLIVGVLWWLVVPYFLWRYTVDKKNYFDNKAWQLFVGIMVFVPCLVGLIEIKEKFGASFLLYLLAVVCAVDVGAYFTGRFFGRHLLTPQISPKKTLEGLFGGLLLALIVTVTTVLLLAYGVVDAGFTFSGVRGVSLLILVVITCLWSVIGDLFESMLKRQAGVKDSGQLLPGHGGIYDRIDSLTAAIPIFVLGILLI